MADAEKNIYKYDKIPTEIDGIEVVQEAFIAFEMLQDGQEVVRFEYGDSMLPFLESGQFCKLVPLKEGEEIEIGDIVFSIVHGTPNTHMVWAKKEFKGKTWYLIGSSECRMIGWTNFVVAKAYGINHYVEANQAESISSFDRVRTNGVDLRAVSFSDISSLRCSDETVERAEFPTSLFLDDSESEPLNLTSQPF